MVEQIIAIIVEFLCAGICFLIGKHIIPKIKQSTAYDNFTLLVDWINKYVQGVEQTTTESGAGAVKFEVVIKLATEKANELGLTVSESDMKMLIESAVKAMNDGETSTIKVEN